MKDRILLINSEREPKVRKFSLTRLRKMYKTTGISFKKVKVRRCWRRPTDLKNIKKDEQMLIDL